MKANDRTGQIWRFFAKLVLVTHGGEFRPATAVMGAIWLHPGWDLARGEPTLLSEFADHCLEEMARLGSDSIERVA